MRTWLTLAVATVAWLLLTVYIANFALSRQTLIRLPAVNHQTTAFLIVVILPALGMLDVGLAVQGGNSATISWVMLGVRVKDPLAALAVVYSFGLFVGHCYFPAVGVPPPPGYQVVARMFIGLSPTFYAMTVIGWGGSDAVEAHKHFLEAGGQAVFGCYTVAAGVAGGLMGHYVLAQHLYAPVR